MVDGPLGRRDATLAGPRDEIGSPSKYARRRIEAAVSLPQLPAPPPPPPPPHTPPVEAVAAADVHLTVTFPAAAGGDGDGSATYMPTEHAGRRSSMAGVASMAGVGRARTTRRLSEAAQQPLGEGEACFSVLTQGPPKLGAASIAGTAGLLPEPPASGSAGQSRPLSPRAATDQLRVQQELEANPNPNPSPNPNPNPNPNPTANPNQGVAQQRKAWTREEDEIIMRSVVRLGH